MENDSNNFVRLCYATDDLNASAEQAEIAKKIASTFPAHSIFWGTSGNDGERFIEWSNGQKYTITLSIY